jgi:hypothetical protein
VKREVELRQNFVQLSKCEHEVEVTRTSKPRTRFCLWAIGGSAVWQVIGRRWCIYGMMGVDDFFFVEIICHFLYERF